MSRRIDFFFDIVSPYTWFAFEVLCRYRPVWQVGVQLRPMLLGGVMEASSNRPPGFVAAKANYMMQHDLPRLAEHFAVPLRMNEQVANRMFVDGTLSTMRFVTAVQQLQPDSLEQLCRELWLRLFTKHLDVHDAASLREAALAAGISAELADSALEAISSQEVKQALRANTDEAVSFGAFGSPTFVLHLPPDRREMVFGSDRFNIIADLLGEQYTGPLREKSKL